VIHHASNSLVINCKSEQTNPTSRQWCGRWKRDLKYCSKREHRIRTYELLQVHKGFLYQVRQKMPWKLTGIPTRRGITVLIGSCDSSCAILILR